MDMIKTEPGKIIFIQNSTNSISSSTDSGKIETTFAAGIKIFAPFEMFLYFHIKHITSHFRYFSQIARQACATTMVPKSQKGFSCGFIGKKTKYYNINIIIVNSLFNPPPPFHKFTCTN